MENSQSSTCRASHKSTRTLYSGIRSSLNLLNLAHSSTGFLGVLDALNVETALVHGKKLPDPLNILEWLALAHKRSFLKIGRS